MKLSVTTPWVSLRVDDEQIGLDLHSTASDPFVHVYSTCRLSDLPLTKKDCDNLIHFFTRLRDHINAQ